MSLSSNTQQRTVGLVMLGTSLALPIALLFGALIAATDPVAVIAVFRSLGVSKKLAILVEGESLFNDGAAVVVFNIILGIALTGHFSLIEGVWEFIIESAGGLGVGLALGWVAAQLIARIDDYLIEKLDGAPRPSIAVMDLAGANAHSYETLAASLKDEFGRLDGLVHQSSASRSKKSPATRSRISRSKRVRSNKP